MDSQDRIRILRLGLLDYQGSRAIFSVQIFDHDSKMWIPKTISGLLDSERSRAISGEVVRCWETAPLSQATVPGKSKYWLSLSLSLYFFELANSTRGIHCHYIIICQITPHPPLFAPRVLSDIVYLLFSDNVSSTSPSWLMKMVTCRCWWSSSWQWSPSPKPVASSEVPSDAAQIPQAAKVDNCISFSMSI